VRIRFYTQTLAVLWATLLPATAAAADLEIAVRQVRSGAGSVCLAVYDNDTSFMKLELATATLKVDASKGEVRFVIHNVRAGRYAVSAYHDENGNGKLDKNWLGAPAEGYGFSNDARGTRSPPRFDRAAFDFDGKADKSISFSLHY
jgi:uncharacterized protein (DUF2141 family)